MRLNLFAFLLLQISLLFSLIIPIPHALAEPIPNISFDIDIDKEDFYTDLNGDWLFFPEKFIQPETTSLAWKDAEQEVVTIPDSFENHTGEINTYGTYITKVTIPKDLVGETLAIHIPFQYSAYTLFVDDKEVASNGNVASNAEFHQAEMAPKVGYFIAASEEIQLTMQISSFEHIRGGFENEIYLGESAIVTQKNNTNMILILFINGSIFIIGLFMVLFSLYRRHGESAFLIFGLFSMLISARALFAVPFFYTIIFPSISWLWGTRLEYIFTEATSMLFVILLWKWHEKVFSKIVMYLLVFIHLATIFLTLFTQPVFFQTLFFNVFTLAIPTFFYTVYVMMKSMRNKNSLAIINVIGMLLIFLAFFNDFAIGKNWYHSVPLMLPAVGIYVLIHVIAMSKDFAARANKKEQQFKELAMLNRSNEQLTTQLQKEIKQKDDFLANTSHELRNPLHAIINISQAILKDEENLNERTKGDLYLQLSIGHHMRQTLNDLLDFTRLKEQQIKLHNEALHLESIVSGVIDMLQVLINNKKIHIHMDFPDDLPPVEADYNRLIQILFNLLHNAVKYTDEGSISLKATTANHFVFIHIIDTGTGIDEDTLQTIFEPYTQAESNNTSFTGGIGLGLSIVRDLIELHGGSIHATSSIGEGSTFTFTLPISNKTVDESKEELNYPLVIEPLDNFKEKLQTQSYEKDTFHKQTSPTTRIHILAVDDDPINLKMLRKILSAPQYEITTANSGEEALELLDSRTWHLVISDVMMPKMSGYELTQIIRQTYSISELPVLLLTARGHIEDISSGFLSGANDYVTKPVDAVELNARVHALTHLQTAIKDRLNMEAAWLQAQIKPHFILNTLNAIISLSEIDLDKMKQLIDKFAHYLQSSFYFKNIDSLIPLQDEIDLVTSYLYIEKIRFGDRLQVEWKVCENIDTENILLPPLVLQTLVENAVNHGILQKLVGGTVTIQITQKDEVTKFTIMDDGVGMDKVTMQQMFTLQQDKQQGIGIINTEERLKKLYGKGLLVTSELGVGTSVSFEIWPL